MTTYHFIGIGGIGMSGLAKILLSQNIPVSGSDLAESPITQTLKEAGAALFIGHSASYITPDATVVFTSDIKESNPEWIAAQQLKCAMLHRSDLLALLMQNHKALAVTGTHGKTTTSSLLSWVLYDAGWDPSFSVGGVIAQLNANAWHGKGQYFVAEADESDGSFLRYTPYGGIITNIDLDHMNYYHTEEALEQAFDLFAKKVESAEHLFWFGDDPRLQKLNMQGVSYGFSPSCQLQITHFNQEEWKTFFDFTFKGVNYHKIEIAQIGFYNVLNSAAVFGLALQLGLEEQAIRKALATFPGVGRRCTARGYRQAIQFIDDYAHHPNEIKVTLQAIREAIGEKRLIVLFQPHRYSRTKDCLGAYRGIFEPADIVYVTDIYAAGEKPIPGVTVQKVYDELRQDQAPLFYYCSRQEIVEKVCQNLFPHDVVVTLGAGDIHATIPKMLEKIELAPPKLKVGIVYGGKSTEHEVSLTSSKYIRKALDRNFYEVCEYLITKEGTWVQQGLEEDEKGAVSPQLIQQIQTRDILFPVLHGTFGEDGTIQGFFEILGRPYVGCDHRSAAISMDKALTKRLAQHAGIPTSPFSVFNEMDWKKDEKGILQAISQKLSFPLFVKPVHLGSSVGIRKVTNEEELCVAIQNAFLFDSVVLVENGILGREIEFAVLGNDQVIVFPPGEVFSNGKLFDYEGKYSSHNAIPSTPKANLPASLIEEGRALAQKAYRTVACQGMARVDFFLDQSGKFWFNEINPIPGFTPFSLYPQMCEANGISPDALIDRLLILGLQRARQKEKKSYNNPA